MARQFWRSIDISTFLALTINNDENTCTFESSGAGFDVATGSSMVFLNTTISYHIVSFVIRLSHTANLDANDSKKFWKQVQKDGCNKVKKFAVSVNGVVGDDNIAAMWKTHFKSVYSSVNSSHHRQVLESRINALVPGTYTKINMDDIIEILCKLKHNKAAGPDRIATEAFIYGTPRLFAHLSIMFSWFLKFGVLPAKFTQSTIVPLVKVRCGDLSDVDN